MRCGYLLPFVLAVHAVAQDGQPRPYLVLDAAGHTAAATSVSFLPDGQRLVTVSSDKSIRIWSVRTGEQLEVLRPPVGPGQAGMLNAVAVSPDGRWLAAGGYEHAGNDHGIYLIALRDLRIATVLRGHTDTILDLAFSPDGQSLASASADKTSRLWSLRTLRSQFTLRGHRDQVYGVAFSPESDQLATASLDKAARIWSLRPAREIAKLSGHTAALQAIDWSPDGSKLATACVDQSINVWSTNGVLQRRISKLGNDVTSVCFTRDSRELFFTLGGAERRDGGFLIDLAANLRASFTRHDDSVLDGALSPDGSLAATADAQGEVCLWRLRDGSLMHRLRGRGQTAWSVGWDLAADAISWGNTSDSADLNHRGPLEHSFQLRSLEFAPLTGAGLQQARTRGASVSLRPTGHSTLTVLRQGRSAAQLALADPNDRIRCFTLLDDSTAAVGSDFGLFLFDTATGRRVRSLTGHQGTVWAIAPSPNGRYLLSAGQDQSLRVWRWRRGELLLSLFFAGREWITWTPAGYYAASAGGERLMGWQVNNGPGRLGSFYPAAQFRQSLYRPAIIRTLLDSGSVQQALAALDLPRRQELTTVQQVLPPKVQITEPAGSPHETSQRLLRVRATAHSRGQHPVTALRLLLNGRPYQGTKGLYVVPRESEETVTGDWTVELTSGRHRLAVQAETAVSKGVSQPIEVVYREAAVVARPRLPDLYVLAIGVADYPGPLRLSYADEDAQVIASTLEQVSAPLFRSVNVQQLTNQAATRRGILGGLSWLRREMTQQDVTVIFFSGHGAKDETGNFYLVPIDGEPADLLATAVSGSQFKDALAAIPGRVLVWLDACHAGAAGGDLRKAAFALTDDLVRDLVTDDYGVVVMCSSMGREYSMESETHRQGYFTVALVEAVTGQADYNQDGLVYITEIDTYLADRVKLLTEGQQHPVTTKPATIRSFPISKSTLR